MGIGTSYSRSVPPKVNERTTWWSTWFKWGFRRHEWRHFGKAIQASIRAPSGSASFSWHKLQSLGFICNITTDQYSKSTLTTLCTNSIQKRVKIISRRFYPKHRIKICFWLESKSRFTRTCGDVAIRCVTIESLYLYVKQLLEERIEKESLYCHCIRIQRNLN